MVFQGNRPLSARFSTQEVIRVAFECPWEDLQNGVGSETPPHTPQKGDIGVDRNRHKLEENTKQCVFFGTDGCGVMVVQLQVEI